MRRLKTWLTATFLTASALPAAACGLPHNGPHVLAFVFETWDKAYAPLPGMLIAITGTGLDKNGNLGRWYDKTADEGRGAMVPYPMKVAEYTPFTHSQTIQPGEAAVMEFTGVFLGKIGQYLTCAVYVDGQLQPEETVEDRIEDYLGGTGGPGDVPIPGQPGGSAVVTCSYTYSAPGGN